MAGGATIERLGKMPEFEVTMPNQADRLMMTAEVSLNHYHVFPDCCSIMSGWQPFVSCTCSAIHHHQTICSHDKSCYD